MDKEIKITPPEGYEIDKENSTFDCIKFKPILKRWADDELQSFDGWFITVDSKIRKSHSFYNVPVNYGVYATEKQAKSALAMARISQIMAKDKRFGGVVTDEEWENLNIAKYTLYRDYNQICRDTDWNTYRFLAFHIKEQRDLFLKENEQLVKDYLMID